MSKTAVKLIFTMVLVQGLTIFALNYLSDRFPTSIRRLAKGI